MAFYFTHKIEHKFSKEEQITLLDMYKKSELELWIEEKYKCHGFFTPKDLEIDNIAKEFNINLRYSKGPDRALWDDENQIYMIFLKPTHSEEVKRNIFFHELCHPLRHYGNQELMNKNTLRELQEEQAHLFQMYAAIPFFMIEYLDDLPNTESELSEVLSKTFKVPISLAKKRVKQIMRKIQQAQLDNQYKQIIDNKKVFNYCKNIKPKSVPKHAEDIVALAISRKLSKEGISI